MTVGDLLTECTVRGIILHAHAGQLGIDAPAGGLTPDLVARLREAKPELLAILAGGPVADPQDDPAGWREFIDAEGRLILERCDFIGESIDPPDPCPTCGNATVWQDGIGRLRCPGCDPPRVDAGRLLTRARAIRARYPIPTGTRKPQAVTRPQWPPEIRPEVLADPIPTCRECGRRRVIPGQPGRPVGMCFDCWTRQAGKGTE